MSGMLSRKTPLFSKSPSYNQRQIFPVPVSEDEKENRRMSIRTVVAQRFADFKRVQDLTRLRTAAYFSFLSMATVGLLATIVEVEILFLSADAINPDNCCRITTSDHGCKDIVRRDVR